MTARSADAREARFFGEYVVIRIKKEKKPLLIGDCMMNWIESKVSHAIWVLLSFCGCVHTTDNCLIFQSRVGIATNIEHKSRHANHDKTNPTPLEPGTYRNKYFKYPKVVLYLIVLN